MYVDHKTMWSIQAKKGFKSPKELVLLVASWNDRKSILVAITIPGSCVLETWVSTTIPGSSVPERDTGVSEMTSHMWIANDWDYVSSNKWLWPAVAHKKDVNLLLVALGWACVTSCVASKLKAWYSMTRPLSNIEARVASQLVKYTAYLRIAILFAWGWQCS